MERRLPFTWQLLKHILKKFTGDRVMRMPALLSYYTLFSLPGLLFLVIALLTIFHSK